MTLFDVIDWYSNFYECRMPLYGKEYGIHLYVNLVDICHIVSDVLFFCCTLLRFSILFVPVFVVHGLMLNDD